MEKDAIFIKKSDKSVECENWKFYQFLSFFKKNQKTKKTIKIK